MALYYYIHGIFGHSVGHGNFKGNVDVYKRQAVSVVSVVSAVSVVFVSAVSVVSVVSAVSSPLSRKMCIRDRHSKGEHKKRQRGRGKDL